MVAIVAYLELAFFSTIVSVAVGFVILGLYSAMTDGVERAFASRLVPHERLATGQGFLNSAVGVSSLLAGVIGGLLWTSYGSQTALLYGAVMMAIGLLTFIYLNRRKETV